MPISQIVEATTEQEVQETQEAVEVHLEFGTVGPQLIMIAFD